MSWGARQGHGNTAEQVSDTSLVLTITNSNVAVGRVLFAVVGSDNEGSGETNLHTSLVDSKGHTWIKVKEAAGRPGSASDLGSCLSLWYTTVTDELVAGVDTITLTLSTAKTNKAISTASFTPDGTVSLVDVVFTTGFSTTPTLSSSVLTSAEYLFVAGFIVEYGQAGLTQDADYATVSTVSPNAAGGADSFKMFWGTRVVTATGDTYEPTSSVGQDNVLILAAFREIASDPPAAPDGVTATVISPHRIDLSWNDNSDDETQFEIYRDEVSPVVAGAGTLVDTVAAGIETYSDITVEPDTTYHYLIRAVAPGGETDSAEDSATTPAAYSLTYLLNHLYLWLSANTDMPASPSAIYVGLLDTIDVLNNEAWEVFAATHTRQALTLDAPLAEQANVTGENTAQLTWDVPDADFGADGVGIFDAATDGNLLTVIQFASRQQFTNGGAAPTYAISDLIVKLEQGLT